MKLAIVGSRLFTQEVLAKSIIYDYCSIWYPDTIVSGGARGPDAYGKEFAFEHGLDYIEHPAQWHEYGKSAGMVRNEYIAQDCDEALIFWDYNSKGTMNMINQLWKYRKNMLVYDFTKDNFHYIEPKRHPLYEEKLHARC